MVPKKPNGKRATFGSKNCPSTQIFGLSARKTENRSFFRVWPENLGRRKNVLKKAENAKNAKKEAKKSALGVFAHPGCRVGVGFGVGFEGRLTRIDAAWCRVCRVWGCSKYTCAYVRVCVCIYAHVGRNPPSTRHTRHQPLFMRVKRGSNPTPTRHHPTPSQQFRAVSYIGGVQ